MTKLPFALAMPVVLAVAVMSLWEQNVRLLLAGGALAALYIGAWWFRWYDREFVSLGSWWRT
jgi:hypothetical protein